MLSFAHKLIRDQLRDITVRLCRLLMVISCTEIV